jgi:hypothetical protein
MGDVAERRQPQQADRTWRRDVSRRCVWHVNC